MCLLMTVMFVLCFVGYSVPLESLEEITSCYSSIGHAGSKQTLFYCEVTDTMRCPGAGGGIQAEGEMIEVVHLPVEQVNTIALSPQQARSVGLCFALMWFQLHKNH